jgi:rfaE bifunctional protein nucleotidyltransferase chain/domain
MIDNPVHDQTMAKIFRDSRDLAVRLEPLRVGKQIVLVKGAYDLFHVGHYYSFANARGFGDLLVVAVQGDTGVKAQKGAERPILPLDDRLVLIAALECVDFVTVYDAPSPFEVLSLLRPDVFAASHFKSLTEEQRRYLERVTHFQFVPKLGGTSTTVIIQKIKGLKNA